ncbi:ABC transporter ATP-binding protein [Blastococcus tunisiensis]|uniref:Amino acid/amide ABC transporter ATP-binding protein 1, HAAT family n=1 Tax=Blastococcus tunisiensis TaxID=1798228 RepID=A0A1I2JKC0_9ACTN|nr:ABC transporter ATP-binding protein [Blastococcus sp. DSM 46838]SFF54689.1 amino acid/amide ABC transporter ATP-binding protein 1, HAAT family [Blastococcus sp. DSM 46838]
MSPQTAAPLDIEGVTVAFGAVKALDDVSFSVQSGHVHGVIGPNGAGKSSLFNVISGVYRPSAGEVRLDGMALTKLRPHEVAGLGIGRSFQNVDLAGEESVLESLLVGRHDLMRSGVTAVMLGLPRARREEREHKARVTEIADFFGLADHLDRPLHELPYGQQKLVDVARAVCMEPRLLMLDEPAAGLDEAETDTISEIILDLRSALDLTVLLIEHDMGMVMKICDHLTVLDFGRRISDGTPSAVQSDPAVASAYLGTGEAAEIETGTAP